MILLTPPRLALTPPPKPGPRLRSVLPIGDNMAVAEAGGVIHVELYGEVFNGNRMVTTLSPADAQRLATELSTLARKLWNSQSKV